MATPILLLNAGSSSIKYQTIDADTEEVLASGLIERIGQIYEDAEGQAKRAAEQELLFAEAKIAFATAEMNESGETDEET